MTGTLRVGGASVCVMFSLNRDLMIVVYVSDTTLITLKYFNVFKYIWIHLITLNIFKYIIALNIFKYIYLIPTTSL